MQGIRVRALVREDPTCRGATKPRAPQLLSPQATTTEALALRAQAPQQEKYHNEKPAHHNKDPTQPTKIIKIKK